MKKCRFCKREHRNRTYTYSDCKKERSREACRKWQYNNRDVSRAASKRWYEANKKRAARFQRASSLKRLYGVDILTYNRLLKRQKGVCAICKRECPSRKRLAVDHDHDTKEIRGLLCMNCNQGLGKFYEKKSLLVSAIKYLEKFK